MIAPMLLGYGVTRVFFPSHDQLGNWFVGATLCATSVGITARVLADLRKTDSREGRIILGAAVIDDVLGLLVLAVVGGIIDAVNRGVAFAPTTVLVILGKAIAFLAAATFIGQWLSPRVFRLAARLPGEGLLLTVAIVFCLGFSYLAALGGLAPIVGAFAPAWSRQVITSCFARAGSQTPHWTTAISTFLVPVFFVSWACAWTSASSPAESRVRGGPDTPSRSPASRRRSACSKEAGPSGGRPGDVPRGEWV